MKMYEEEIQVRNITSFFFVSFTMLDCFLTLLHFVFQQEWYAEYSRENLSQQDQILDPDPDSPASESTQTRHHSIN